MARVGIDGVLGQDTVYVMAPDLIRTVLLEDASIRLQLGLNRQAPAQAYAARFHPFRNYPPTTRAELARDFFRTRAPG